MNVELSDRAHLEMRRIDAAWRKQADFPELFLEELLETVEWIETRGVLGTPYQVKAKLRLHRTDEVRRRRPLTPLPFRTAAPVIDSGAMRSA